MRHTTPRIRRRQRQRRLRRKRVLYGPWVNRNVDESLPNLTGAAAEQRRRSRTGTGVAVLIGYSSDAGARLVAFEAVHTLFT